VSCIAKGLLPYRDLGSGIKPALEDCQEIEFVDDRDANLFTASVHREELIGSVEPDCGMKTAYAASAPPKVVTGRSSNDPVQRQSQPRS
jgi:hypothetical protein